MNTTLRVAGCIALALSATALADDKTKTPPPINAEQQAMADAYQRMGEVRAEHKRLAYFVGNWQARMTTWMDPKAPPQTSEGKSSSEAVFDGRYIQTRHEGTFMGQSYRGEGVLGFDNLRGRYFNTWMDNMSTGIWLAWGSYDAARNAYAFHGQMDDPMKPGAKVPVREVIRIVDPAHYVFEWYETRKGKEAKTMQIEYARQ
ncbi:MAG: DUF1579 domain-containing protein [Mizugakiibacter sp.]|uniref:DUF1579 domain-containing protein n=1 Tax=Mizugakiibacter sp. TaxID=1972610 RepID=UPI0031C24598|nr:DUF1579 domain-containing protein [Xanthomonadaceae bacterium]